MVGTCLRGLSPAGSSTKVGIGIDWSNLDSMVCSKVEITIYQTFLLRTCPLCTVPMVFGGNGN